MRGLVARAAVFVTLAASAASTGCTLEEQGVKAAEAPVVKTGNSKFDEFFVAVRDVRDQARAAPSDADNGHTELVRALGLDAKARGAATLDAAGARAKKLQDKGVLLHLEIAPEPRVIAVRGKVEVGPDGEVLFKAMEGTIRTSLEVRRKFAGIAARAADLEKKRAELRDQIDDTFKDQSPAWRADLVANLETAKAVLADASDGATRAAGAESRFVVDLVYAVETGGGTRVEPVATAKPLRGRATAGRAPSAGAPVTKPAVTKGDTPKPPPAPKKPKGGGDDFEP